MLIPFQLPWLLQGYIFTDVHPFFLTIKKKTKCLKDAKVKDAIYDVKDEEVERQEGKKEIEQENEAADKPPPSRTPENDSPSLETLSNIFFSG